MVPPSGLQSQSSTPASPLVPRAPGSSERRFASLIRGSPDQSGNIPFPKYKRQRELGEGRIRGRAAETYSPPAAASQNAALITPGMRGQARILVDDRTIYQWLKLYFFETFRFRV